MPLSKDGDTPSAVRNPISAWSTQKRTAAHARRRFKRKNGGFWRAQFCTEVAHPTRFERVTFAFGGHGSSRLTTRASAYNDGIYVGIKLSHIHLSY